MPTLRTSNAILHSYIKSVKLILVNNFTVIKLCILYVGDCHFSTRLEVLLISLKEFLNVWTVAHKIHFSEIHTHFSCWVKRTCNQDDINDEPDDSAHVVQKLWPDDHPTEHLHKTILLNLLLCCFSRKRTSTNVFWVFFIIIRRHLLWHICLVIWNSRLSSSFFCLSFVLLIWFRFFFSNLAILTLSFWHEFAFAANERVVLAAKGTSAFTPLILNPFSIRNHKRQEDGHAGQP